MQNTWIDPPDQTNVQKGKYGKREGVGKWKCAKQKYETQAGKRI